MRIKSLHCQNIRLYRDFELSIDQNLVIFVGNNGQGKTTLLECIYLAALSKSFRSYYDQELIAFDQSQASLTVCFEKDNTLKNKILLTIGKEKQIFYNGLKVQKRSDIVGKLLVVLFTPDDLLLFKMGASLRRNFLNIELSKLDVIYMNEAIKVNKLIKKRNLILKDTHIDHDLLAVITHQLIEAQLVILNKRIAYLKKLAVYASDFYQQLTQHTEEHLSLEYVPFTNSFENDYQSLELLYQNSLKRDLKYRQTHLSVNKDDFVATIDQHLVSKYASQGQMRSVALALKLASMKIISDTTKHQPILLLDDVLSEFDQDRINFLMSILEDQVQTFITTTTLNEFSSQMIAKAQVISIDTKQLNKEDKNGK